MDIIILATCSSNFHEQYFSTPLADQWFTSTIQQFKISLFSTWWVIVVNTVGYHSASSSGSLGIHLLPLLLGLLATGSSWQNPSTAENFSQICSYLYCPLIRQEYKNPYQFRPFWRAIPSLELQLTCMPTGLKVAKWVDCSWKSCRMQDPSSNSSKGTLKKQAQRQRGGKTRNLQNVNTLELQQSINTYSYSNHQTVNSKPKTDMKLHTKDR